MEKTILKKRSYHKLCIRLFFLSILFSFSLNMVSQNQKITISTKQASYSTFFQEIEKQTGMTIAYNENTIDVNRNVTADISNKTLTEALTEILKNTGLDFTIKGKQIIITAAPAKATPKKITGTITDETGEPIIGATIKVKDTSIGTITDFDGKYTIEANPNSILLVSYVGYLPSELRVGDQNSINLVMKEDTQLLDEVVVVGYGTMKKRDLTGAVSSVKMSDNPVATVSSVSQVLAGKAAGFQVSTVSAQPGGGTSFRIRGAASPEAGMNDPLIIIDGFPVNSPESDDQKASGGITAGRYKSGTTDNILSSINPSDIESIEVLKDASSSAIYGSRAGNGVIIITTKRGKAGTPVVKYSGTASVQSMSRKYEVLGARDFMIEANRYEREAYLRKNGIAPYGNTLESSVGTAYVPRYSDSQISNPINDTRWFDEVTRTGFQTQHNVSISGGNESTQYLVSGNFFRQNGIVKNNDMSRYSGRLNLDQKLSRFFRTGINFTVSRNNYDNVPLGKGQGENASILVAAAQFNPLLPIKDEKGDYVLNSEASFLPNPVSLLEITDKTIKERLLATAYLEYEPIPNLKIRGNFGIDRNYQKRKVYLPKTTLYGYKKDGQADLNQDDRSDYLAEFTVNYMKSIGDHSFTVLGGYSFQKFDQEGLGASNNRFLTDGFLYNNIGQGAEPSPTVFSSGGVNEMASFFGRINYSYKDRYLLTATLRADGASNFTKDNRWGYFPSVSLGWRFIDEDFSESLRSFMSNGKLRASYGQTGRSNIGNRTFSYYTVGNNNTFGDSESQGIYLGQIGNPQLKWETTSEWNFGLDLGFLNSKINVTAEYFNRTISDLLHKRNLQSYNEVTTIWDNIGKTQSRGFELTINTQNVQTKDFTWSSDFTFSLYRDKWKERGDYWKPNGYTKYDSPLRATYGYLSDGLIQAGENVPHMAGGLPGQVKIKDIDGFKYNEDGSIAVDEKGNPIKTGVPDGKIDDADKVFYGSNDPGFLLGLNNTIRWKNFDLNIYFYGQFDKTSYGSYKDLWLSGTDGMTGVVNLYRSYNMPVTAKEVWSHDNQNGTRPGYFQDQSIYGVGDFFKQDAWFIRCRNITLGYNFKMKQGPKIFTNMRIYADINNPFVITPYKGLDPETDDSVWSYPNVRTYSLGIDITF